MKASNEFEQTIKNYLESVKHTIPNLSQALVQEGKSITDCCNFIIQEVKKQKVSVLTDNEVYDLATAYYLDQKITKIDKVKCHVISPALSNQDAKKEGPKAPKKEKVTVEIHSNQMSIFDLIEP